MSEQEKGKVTGLKEARARMERYCAYRERCHSETREKLYSLGLRSGEVDEVMEHLVRKGFLNEERFARAFAGGKFRQNKWGRNKIVRELKRRGVSEYCIKKALSEIDTESYTESIRKIAEKYAATLRGESAWTMKQKTMRYLIGKGFEPEQCHLAIESLIADL